MKVTEARVDAVRKAKNQQVVLRCRGEEDTTLMEGQLRMASAGLTVETLFSKNPLVEIRDVLQVHSEKDVLDHFKGRIRRSSVISHQKIKPLK